MGLRVGIYVSRFSGLKFMNAGTNSLYDIYVMAHGSLKGAWI